MDKYNKVEFYLNNEKELFETWYKKTKNRELGYDTDVELKSAIPSLSTIKKSFKKFFDKNQKKLFRLICKEFNYIEKKENYKTHIELAIAISEVISPDYADSLEVSSILIKVYLDNLCLKA